MTNNYNLLDQIQIILCNTSHPGNIGSAARAMKTMGLTKLTLLSPLTMPDDHSLALACNAKDVVEQCLLVQELDLALTNSTLTIAMTGRKREFNDRLYTPKEIIPQIFEAIGAQQQVSIVFGNETNGLNITQLEKCNRLVSIPGNPAYFSLNLAQAVQIICYEIYSHYNANLEYLKKPIARATHLDIQHLLSKWNELLGLSNFYTSKNQIRTMRRLQQIIHKADLEKDEADLIHGMLNSLKKHLKGEINEC